MKKISANPDLVAFCGIYCGACKSFLKNRCQGCYKKIADSGCKVRFCCLYNDYSSCADCKTYIDPAECHKYNDLLFRAIDFFRQSDRRAGIMQIRKTGLTDFAEYMAHHKMQYIRPDNAGILS